MKSISNFLLSNITNKDEIIKRMHACMDKAAENREQAQERQQIECTTDCDRYIEQTTGNCNVIVNCTQLCNDSGVLNSHAIYAESTDRRVGINSCTDFKKKIEDEITNRTSCINQSKNHFKKEYKEKCMKVIEEAQQAKGTNATLLCKKNATKGKTECEEYCLKKAEKYHDSEEALSSNSIAEMHCSKTPWRQLFELLFQQNPA